MTPSIQNYLKAIYHLELLSEEAISTHTIAENLGIAAPPATRMLQKMAKSNWLVYNRYKGVRLTDEGRRQALIVLRAHRILETYLVEQLGYSWDEVHPEADRLEHAASPLLLERLSAAMGYPTRDPHGSPIPNADGSLPADEPVLSLKNSPLEAPGVVARVNDEDPGLLRHLAELGLTPGASIRRLDADAPWGTYPIRVNGQDIAVHEGVASHVFIRLKEEEEASR
jgi:DtxR family Mn-dependent transcriptional regulator